VNQVSKTPSAPEPDEIEEGEENEEGTDAEPYDTENQQEAAEPEPEETTETETPKKPATAKKAPATDEPNTDEKPAKKPADRKRTAAMALTVVAALCAAWFGWSWYGAAHDDSLSFSTERDEALRAGEQAVQNLNTLDYRSLDQGLKLWQDSSSSELYQQIVQGRPQFEQAVKKAQTITSAKVLDAAVTELDQHAGKAGVIVALQITVTPPKGEPTVKKTRLVGQLTRTATGWKLSALSQAPVGASG
jgi:Mce-associated membrane protein